MNEPRKEGRAPYPQHEYGEGMFNPHDSQCWLLGMEESLETQRQRKAAKEEREWRKKKEGL